MKVVVSGSSGLIGTALSSALRAQGHEVTALVRRSPSPTARGAEVEWDPRAGRIDPAVLEGCDAVVNLAGAGIGDHRWTPAYRQTILDSRVDATTSLATAVAALDRPPALVSASAIGIYGDRGDEVLDETSARGTGFLADVCARWEAATAPAAEAGARVVHLRSGIVLSKRGGALRKQLPLFKLGLGGRFGSGRQWQSWISLHDEVRAIAHLLGSDLAGPVDLTAPHPVTNAEFARELGRALHRPVLLPVPAIGPRLLLGRELADSLLFHSQRVLPRALETDGFTFHHPTLDEALRAELA